MLFFLEFFFYNLFLFTLSFFLARSVFFSGAPASLRCALAAHISPDNRQLICRIVIFLVFLNNSIVFFDLIFYNATVLDNALLVCSMDLLYDLLFAYIPTTLLHRGF